MLYLCTVSYINSFIKVKINTPFVSNNPVIFPLPKSWFAWPLFLWIPYETILYSDIALFIHSYLFLLYLEGRETDTDMPAVGSLPQCTWQPGLGPWAPEGKGKETKYLAHHLLPPTVCISRKMKWKQSWDSNADTRLQDVGIPSGNFNTAPDATPGRFGTFSVWARVDLAEGVDGLPESTSSTHDISSPKLAKPPEGFDFSWGIWYYM